MKTKRIIALAVLAVFLAGLGYVFFYVRDLGFSAREEPTWLEAVLARNARSIATPASAKSLTNPEADTEENRIEAREHFVEHCAMCHGTDGRGGGVFGRNMYPRASDLTDSRTQDLSDGELFYVISKGVRLTGMPAFEGEDSQESIWRLVSLIRRLPQLPPDELEEMRRQAGEVEADELRQPREQDESTESTPTPRKKRPAKRHTHAPGTKPHGH